MERVKQILATSPNHMSTQTQKTCDLSSFDSFVPVKGSEETLALFRELASGQSVWKLLLCYGTTGNGKTHLCELLAGVLGAKVITWSEMVRCLKRNLEPDKWGITNYEDIFQRLQKCSALILDDVGAGASSSDWAWRELEDIVDYRYNNNLLTVITTNLNLNKTFPSRITSRFKDAHKSRLVLNRASDYRPLKERS